jgi:hypothetical protein
MCKAIDLPHFIFLLSLPVFYYLIEEHLIFQVWDEGAVPLSLQAA